MALLEERHLGVSGLRNATADQHAVNLHGVLPCEDDARLLIPGRFLDLGPPSAGVSLQMRINWFGRALVKRRIPSPPRRYPP